jgi:hypothetical protein
MRCAGKAGVVTGASDESSFVNDTPSRADGGPTANTY